MAIEPNIPPHKLAYLIFLFFFMMVYDQNAY